MFFFSSLPSSSGAGCSFVSSCVTSGVRERTLAFGLLRFLMTMTGSGSDMANFRVVGRRK